MVSGAAPGWWSWIEQERELSRCVERACLSSCPDVLQWRTRIGRSNNCTQVGLVTVFSQQQKELKFLLAFIVTIELFLLMRALLNMG